MHALGKKKTPATSAAGVFKLSLKRELQLYFDFQVGG